MLMENDTKTGTWALDKAGNMACILKRFGIQAAGLILMLFLLSAISAPARPNEAILRVGVLEDSPPYDFYDAHNRLIGLNLDLIREAARRDGKSVALTVIPYNRVMIGLLFKHYDVVIAPQSVNPYRQSVVQFLSPYLQSGDVIVYHAGRKPLESLADIHIRHLRIAAFNGTSYPGFLKENGLEANMVVFPTQREMFMAFLNGKVDAMLMDEQIARYYRDQEHFPFALSMHAVRSKKTMAFSVRKEDQTLAAQLNKSMHAMQTDGAMNRILAHWHVQGGSP